MISDSLIAIASFSPKSIQFPNAWVGHLPFAAWVISQVKPKIFVELGTHSGNSYFSFCQSVVESDLASKCYAVDTWEGDEHAGQYDDKVFLAVNEHHQANYAGFSRLLRMTFDDAAAYFADESVDLLHIDGLHTYDAVKHDFETWLPKLAPGAVVIFHDTNVRERDFGVWKLWEELQACYPNNMEFVHSNGLGVLQLNNSPIGSQLNWLQSDFSEKRKLITYFSALGSHYLKYFELNEVKQHAANLEFAIADRDTRIVSLEHVALDRDQKISNLALISVGYDASISSFVEVAAKCDKKMNSLAQGVAERDEKIGNLDQVVLACQSQLTLIDNEMIDRNRVIQALSGTVAELRNSFSWRVTQPLRHVGLFRRKANDVWAIGLRLFQTESLPNLLTSLLRVWRREGMRGLKTRIRQQHYIATHSATGPLSAPLGFALEQAAIVRDQHGSYGLVPVSKGYTYIAPQCPADFVSRLASLESRPLFSIVVPVYNTTPELLAAVLASVQGQWYPHWQLILADDASPSEATREALARINHPQIKLLRLEKNEGIAGATNVALGASDGDFIVFMDHDDEITVDCLYELALCIERDQPDFIYSDEDKLTALGEYSAPHFKPEWSPDTMMSTMFTGHVSCLRRSLLEKIGGLRSLYDGCQDWDFVLRLSEQTDRISHIPKVLYHWRVIPGSIASDIAAKSYILDASKRVREDALIRRRLNGVVEPIAQMPGYFRVAYQLQGNPLISIIIPTRDNEKVLRRCVDTIFELTSYRRFELIILDNGSIEPGSVAYLQKINEMKEVTVIRHDAPFNFSELNNIGVRAAVGDLLLFLNDDTEVLQEDWLERLGAYAQLGHVGAVGAKLLYPGKGQIQHAGILNLGDGPGHAFLLQDSDSPGYFMRNLLEYNWLAVTGACLMVARDKFNAIEGFSESLPIAYNDIDLCMRLHDAGFYNVVCQAVRLLHHESVSRGIDNIDSIKAIRLKQDMVCLYERNPGYFQYDPFHNPNLHPNGINFEVPV